VYVEGIAQVKPGARVGDIGAAIQEYRGSGILSDCVGHGVGRRFHTELNFGERDVSAPNGVHDRANDQ